MVDRSDITPELCRQLFDFDPNTGAFLWKRREPMAGSDANGLARWNARWTGKPAMKMLDSRGYCYARLFNRWQFFAHRVAWAIHYGKWPDMEIDHINGNKSDNRITNLREVTTAENLRNKSLYKNSSSDISGVMQIPGSGKWRARIEGHDLGSYYTKNEAIAARRAGEKILRYHPNHGRPK